MLAYVLTHGKDEGSSVDVYSELPPGFTAALQTKGVTYSGLSPVDGATVEQVLSHAPTDVAAPSGVDPIVLRTSFSDTAQGASFQDRAALMVVVPQSQRVQRVGLRRLPRPHDVHHADLADLLRRRRVGVTLVTSTAWPSRSAWDRPSHWCGPVVPPPMEFLCDALP